MHDEQKEARVLSPPDANQRKRLALAARLNFRICARRLRKCLPPVSL
jgi:hypothetical protein